MPLCPGCHKPYTDDVVICVPCGINLKTGARLSTQQHPLDSGDVENNAVQHSWLKENLPGVLKPKVLGFSALLGALGFGVTLFAIYLLLATGGEMIFGIFCIAFVGATISGQAYTWLISGELWLMNAAFLEFKSRDWTTLALMLIVPIALITALLKVSLDAAEKAQPALSTTSATAASAAGEISEYTIKSLTPLSDELGGSRSQLASGPGGSIYFAEIDGCKVYRMDLQSGGITAVAGTGEKNYAGDGKPALNAALNFPHSVAVNKDGDVFIFDSRRIRKIDAKNGIITTIAGTTGKSDNGDSGPAKTAKFGTQICMSFDEKGDLLIADADAHRIQRLDLAKGMVETIAGTGKAGFSGDGGPANAAQLNAPRTVAADKNGNLYIADRGNYRIRKIDKASGNISTIAGSGAGNDGNGASALTAKFGSPLGLAVAENGDIYFVTSTHRIHRFNAASATVNTIAGSGRNSEGIEDEVGLMTGDGGPSLKAPLSSPSSIVLAPDDSIIIGDARNQLIRRLIPTGK